PTPPPPPPSPPPPPVSPASEIDQLISDLRAAGATVVPDEEISQPFFSVEGKIIKINNENVQVFEYASIEAAGADAAEVSPDGSSVGTTMVSWMSAPHFYKSGRLIVLYVGTDETVTGVLGEVLGKQFAGRMVIVSPLVSILEPADGATVPAGNVRVSIQVSGFELVSKLGQPNTVGEGHVHYYLDAKPPVTPGQPAVTAAGTYAASAERSHTWQNVAPGSHTLAAQLVNNDHTPLATPVVAQVTINVEALAPVTSPTLRILTPAGGTTLPAGPVAVTIVVGNFSPVSKLGQPNAAGEGHVHYYLDAEPPVTPGQPAVTAPGTYAASAERSHTWQNVTPGSHTLAAQLVNNDHTPLEPPVVAEVTINVAIPTGQSITINLNAQYTAFDKGTISVPAGANVTIVFNNQEIIPHSFSLYQDSTATSPIFVGETIVGPRTVSYQFIAPSTPGTYFFRCDVHPTFMTGSLIVTADGDSDVPDDGDGY
ncbi:MAG: DUF4399 domain-containing protein, partial [Dehalococcoidales bacterium]|nr:DUF4399 domain-containing protein [Dehalococcoidales bacterium]